MDVEITYGFVGDKDIVENRRKIAFQLLKTVTVRKVREDRLEDLEIDFKKDLGIDSTIFHLKLLCVNINDPIYKSYFFYEHVFLSDDQLLVDLFLDVLSIKENHLRFLQYIIRRKITVENDKDFGNFNQRLCHFLLLSFS